MSLPIIPTFRFCSSSRSLPSAFTPYLQEPLFNQMHDELYYELAGRPPVANSIVAEPAGHRKESGFEGREERPRMRKWRESQKKKEER